MEKQPSRHPACLNVYCFAAVTFVLTPVFRCDAFNEREVIKYTNKTELMFTKPKYAKRALTPVYEFYKLILLCNIRFTKAEMKPTFNAKPYSNGALNFFFHPRPM